MTTLALIPPLSALPLEHLAHLTVHDLAALEAWRARINESLVKSHGWQEQQPKFTVWVAWALALLEPQLGAGQVPAWEVLLDARYGLLGPTKAIEPLDPAHRALVEPLRGLPVEWLERVMEVALALLDARHGQLVRTYLQAGEMPTTADEARLVRKTMLHELHPSELDRLAVPRAYWHVGTWPWWRAEDYPWPCCPPWEIWRREMARTARVAGLPHPDDDSMLDEWLSAIPIKPPGRN